LPLSFPNALHGSHRRRIGALAGALVALIGALVLGGWLLRIDTLTTFMPGAAQMKPNAALALLLSGLALATPASHARLRLLAPALGTLVAAIGVATLVQYMSATDLHLDELMFREHASAFDGTRGAMSPFTAWGLVLAGLCLLVRHSPRLGWVGSLSAVQLALVGAVALLGYAWNATELVTRTWLPPVAAHTGFAFLLLGTGLLLDTPPPQASKHARRGQHSDRALVLAFWCMVAVLLAAASLTYRWNNRFMERVEEVGASEGVRLRLARVQGCASDAGARHDHYLLSPSKDGERQLTETMTACRQLLADLAPRMQRGVGDASEFALLEAAFGSYVTLVQANMRQLAERGPDAAREAWHADTEHSLLQIGSLILSMDAIQAGHAADQTRSRSADRAAMLVSLLVTLIVCVSILAALTRVMLEKVRENNRIREESERQKLLLAAVINSAPDPLAYRDRDGTYLGANEAYATMVSRPLATLVGGTLDDVFGSERGATMRAHDNRALAGADAWRNEEWITFPDGSLQLMEIIRTPLRDGDGSISGVLTVGRNVTQRNIVEKEAERARVLAEEAAELKSAFLANMSHEIRTPMTGVLGMLDLLAAEDLTERQARYVQAMRTSGRHLLSIINDILDFSRIEAGKLQLESVDFSLPQLMEELRSLLQPMATDRGLGLDIELQPELPSFLRGDPTRLRQIVLNLAGNAIKFTLQGSVRIVVTGRSQPAGTEIAFAVRDTGIGIPADKLKTLFSPFTQGDQSTARAYGGSGLGLAISKRLAEAMGGRLEASSVVDVGSAFRLELTLPAGSAPAVSRTEGPLEAASRPMRILVAEDVEINRDLLGTALARQGHQVAFAVNGAEAVAQVQKREYDLVLMDVQMPVLDGVAATRRIRALAHPVATIPILGLTANVLATETQRYLAAGMNECLAKPIDWQQLAAAIRRYGDGAMRPAHEAEGAAQAAPAVIEALDARRVEMMRTMAGDESFPELMERAFESAAAKANIIVDAFAPRVLQEEAHRLKGLAGTMGFAALFATAARVEEAAGEGTRDEEAIRQLPRELEATADALRAQGLLRTWPR
jgi:PAS domain S-box-containing protein